MPIFAFSAPQVRWIQSTSDLRRATVEVTGLPAESADWPKLLSVYADQGDPISDTRLPPMLGRYSFASNTLHFEPMFPLEPGVTYRAVLAGEKPVVAVFRVPKRATSPTTVVSRIYPSADVLPENLLKFYVHFSAPMSRGGIYNYIELRGESGRPIELPFLELDEELWDPPMQRLTLFIDPGRIKRGVKPLEEVGPALEAGKAFSLVIRRDWHDATGAPLKSDFVKKFRVGPPDRDPPDPGTWKIEPPKAQTTDPLRVHFPKPMDHALALRLFSVENVQVAKTMLDDERQLILAPEKPWQPGSYKLLTQMTIEDLAGNNIGKPFEVDVFNGVQRRLTNSVVAVPFQVTP